MRTLPVMDELIRRGHELVLVTDQKRAEAAVQYLGRSVARIICDTDAGLIVKPGTLQIDQAATTERVRDHVAKWPELIAMAPDADAYVVDIVPWALWAAKEKGIPSCFMASFTWIEQYEPFLPEHLLETYRDAFKQADRVLYYDLVNPPTRALLGNGVKTGFVARPFHEDKVAEIRAAHKRPIVFLSLGASNSGLDFEMDVSGLPYDFISTPALHLKGDNVEVLDVLVENTQDYVKAADFCIAKAGWTTVSEMMLVGVKAGVLERKDTPEDTMIIEELRRRGAAVAISVSELRDMGAVLEKMSAHTWPEVRYENDCQHIVDLICGSGE